MKILLLPLFPHHPNRNIFVQSEHLRKWSFLTFFLIILYSTVPMAIKIQPPLLPHHISGDNDLKKLEFTLPEDVSNHVSASLNELFSRKRFLRSTEKNSHFINFNVS